jgi:hypothetical protein
MSVSWELRLWPRVIDLLYTRGTTPLQHGRAKTLYAPFVTPNTRCGELAAARVHGRLASPPYPHRRSPFSHASEILRRVLATAGASRWPAGISLRGRHYRIAHPLVLAFRIK